MADFKQAIQWLKEGKEIYREYNATELLSLDKYDYIISNGQQIVLNLYHLEATDWVIHKIDEKEILRVFKK